MTETLGVYPRSSPKHTHMEIVKYSDKSFVVVGNTYEFRATLKAMGGKWNKHLRCGQGWVFPTKALDKVKAFIEDAPPPKPRPRVRHRSWGGDSDSDLSWSEQRSADLYDYASQFNCPIQRAEIRAGC